MDPAAAALAAVRMMILARNCISSDVRAEDVFVANESPGAMRGEQGRHLRGMFDVHDSHAVVDVEPLHYRSYCVFSILSGSPNPSTTPPPTCSLRARGLPLTTPS